MLTNRGYIATDSGTMATGLAAATSQLRQFFGTATMPKPETATGKSSVATGTIITSETANLVKEYGIYAVVALLLIWQLKK